MMKTVHLLEVKFFDLIILGAACAFTIAPLYLWFSGLVKHDLDSTVALIVFLAFGSGFIYWWLEEFKFRVLSILVLVICALATAAVMHVGLWVSVRVTLGQIGAAAMLILGIFFWRNLSPRRQT